jgi:hypothetical protein
MSTYRPILMNERTLPDDVASMVRALLGKPVAYPARWRRGSEFWEYTTARGLEPRVAPVEGLLPAILRVFFRGKPCRMRRIIDTGTLLPTFEFPSAKMNDFVHCEGFNEFHFIKTLDVDWAVAAMYEQPFLLLFEYAGKVHGYTPDLEIIYIDHSAKVRDVKAPGWKQENRFVAIRSSFAQLGVDFDTVHVSEVQREPRWSNVEELLEFRHDDVSFDERLRIANLLNGAPRASTLRSLMIENPDINPDSLLAMVARGDLRVDLDRPLYDGPLHWGGKF